MEGKTQKQTLIDRDTKKAFDYTSRACNEMNDILGCLNASLMLRKGDGIERNQQLAEVYRTKADDLKRELDSFRQQQEIRFGEQHVNK